MFKRHEFTCPDVIYLVDRQKKINRLSWAAVIVFYGGLWVTGQALADRVTAELEELEKS